MKFCTTCQTLLSEKIVGNVFKFHCFNCDREFDAGPGDTLRSRITFKKSDEGVNYFVKKFAAHNTSPLRVSAECPKCKKMPYLTKIYSDNLVPEYVCTSDCGYSADHKEYLMLLKKKSEK